MRAIRLERFEPLHSIAVTRQMEAEASAALPDHTLMARAGLAVAKLARAIAPHARCIWVACGPGNNGGDGLVAARHLHEWANAAGGTMQVVVTHWQGTTPHGQQLPPDARWALGLAQEAGVVFAEHPPEHVDLAIDALFGIGRSRPPEGEGAHWLQRLHQSAAPVLCVDVPSGLNADTGVMANLLGSAGAWPGMPLGPRHTLSLLTLKPGLFTAQGRDHAGRVWLDDLGCSPLPPTAWLAGRAPPAASRPLASHKGSHGDVAVIGGQDMAVSGVGMTGAALLAARAALHGGAGRVFVGLLAPDATAAALTWDPVCPELMFRRTALLLDPDFLHSSTVVAGCGGGTPVGDLVPTLLAGAPRLVLDADALNAVAKHPEWHASFEARARRGWVTVLTPHPLEAARLLGLDTTAVMIDRLAAAQALSERFQALCVLKGSGTIVAAPGRTPLINPTGNAALATAGTGDVLAGWLGSALAAPRLSGEDSWDRVAAAVHQHGWLADRWTSGRSGETLSASRLASQVMPVA
ncbi:MAG: NAD(P)H-hydrate dehydratase [Hydrogenophaga sp.]|nr:NAD(P)H-hydrate dehydratase [Hydrogenophaga sp.]